MSKIVSLTQARKTKAKNAKRAKANENALRFGRSKAEKDLEKRRAEKAARDLEGHKRDD
ncbi:MAG: DUF4169 family protein [Maritimibacter sp.]